MAALFTIAKIWKQPKCPSIDKGIMLNEISQAEKDKYHTISLICVI